MGAYRDINILGTRGIPAAHGGFETFAQHLALYLRDRGWNVTVYCQADNNAAHRREDDWNGIRRVHFGTAHGGPIGTVQFDLRCVLDVLRRPGIDLVLGYNTAILNVLQRLAGRRVLMNMDGIEWKRGKWPLPARAWFYCNEVIGSNTCSTAIADHPEIARHLARRSFRPAEIIPYGAASVSAAPVAPLDPFGLHPSRYMLTVARMEPENSILEMVSAFSARPRGMKYLLLGALDPSKPYHRRVRAAASDEVVFAGAIYDRPIVQALRFHAYACLHGHQVGGTNPSLVEAMGAGSAIIAHDNRFNRWTAGEGQLFFTDINSCSAALGEALTNSARITVARQMARQRHQQHFRWEDVLHAYEQLLLAPEIRTAPQPMAADDPA
ncbi:hypothetical protein VW29_18050 [Devosia limi DSM 17137]|uniref:Glycosyltransferase involved in cell wall bisynthesis n=1 Tax=Devosia limi DSM 17137 TaxID=1121477 RepID=A0A0F5L6M9_9HYPH|nr:DUF1972 domain-containing protein [Devosia limi]KKB77277.1 hypothetical protein VW29_18050 [Devosia limi DSM 17137]SHE64383.1 Glycosyltransferase involved in cell wall bisynthesis [Devosia limi DSM 17137]